MAVAAGTAVTRCPPHRPVLALLTHTVPTSDVGVFGVETHARVRLQYLDRRQQQAAQALPKTLPGQAAALTSTPKRLIPDTLHRVAERFQPRPVARNSVTLEIPQPAYPVDLTISRRSGIRRARFAQVTIGPPDAAWMDRVSCPRDKT